MSSIEPAKGVLTSEEFGEAMSSLTTPLCRWAAAWASEPDRHGYLPAAGSRAMAELAAEHLWATPQWVEPARNAHSYGHVLSYALAEHLAALSTIIRHTEVGPAFAHMPPVRAIVDAVPLAHWLLDPSITAEARIKRSTLYRLKSANELGRMQHLPAVVVDSQTTRQRCLDFARRNGWRVANNTIGGEEMPAAKKNFSKVALGQAKPDLDHSMWAMVSSAHHSTWYALVASFKHGITISTTFDPRGGVAPIVVDGRELATYAVMCWQGCAAVARSRDELMGWDAGPEMDESAEEIRRQASLAKG